jgi:4-phospho-D-threonate 3-dehydrogenase / 4-phospho-D-erythronate 3-dehydrogenase
MAGSVPRIAITAGDPAGVGPEITAKALAARDWRPWLTPVVIGDAAVFGHVLEATGIELEVREISEPGQATGAPDLLEVIDCGVVSDVTHGVVDEAYGRAAIAYIEKACEVARAGEVDGMVTGPINKEAIWAAGSRFPGHTEMLAHLFDVPEHEAVTMFVLGKLKIFFLTRHHSLLDAIALLDTDHIVEFLTRVDSLTQTFGLEKRPHLALSALNPHGGENGKMGREEIEILAPAVELARRNGIDVVGPVPADAVFHQGRQGRYDGVVALHHDQGHIAAKTLDFFGTVACELGLPIIRATVDHGTAFDIAGKWIANADGQVRAMEVAAELAPGVKASVAAGALEGA